MNGEVFGRFGSAWAPSYLLYSRNRVKTREFAKFVKLVVWEGHYVWEHSMSHQYKKLYEEGNIISEMKENFALIHGKSPFGTATLRLDPQDASTFRLSRASCG